MTLTQLLASADATWDQHCAELDRLARATLADTSSVPVRGNVWCPVCGARLARGRDAVAFVCEGAGHVVE